MLDGELERQKRLKGELANDPAATAWLDERHIFQNYKQLQFFDTLGLYFHLRQEAERGEEVAAFVVRKAEVSEGELIAHCRASLAPYKIPQGVFFLDALPRSGMGKVLKTAHSPTGVTLAM